MVKAQQSPAYQLLPQILRGMREQAGMTQRDLGQKLKKPQSWVYNCETANRRIDITEFVLWCRACETDPAKAFAHVVAKMK